MVNLKIHNTKVKLKDEWKDISLREALELSKIAFSLPEYVKDLFHEKLKESPDESRVEELIKQISPEDQFKKLPALYGDMLSLLSDISEPTLASMSPTERKVVYDHYLSPLVLGLIVWPAYESKGITSFKHKGTTYRLPSSTELFGYTKPGVSLTALEFTEIADLQIAAAKMEEGQLSNAAKIIAIICRPEGEAYDEVISGRRSEEFLDLPMDVVWEVFFSLVESTIILQQHSLLSILQVEADRLRSLKWKATVGMPASSKWRKRALLAVSLRFKKPTLTTS